MAVRHFGFTEVISSDYCVIVDIFPTAAQTDQGSLMFLFAVLLPDYFKDPQWYDTIQKIYPDQWPLGMVKDQTSTRFGF